MFQIEAWKSQESFTYFKIFKPISLGKRPAERRCRLIQRFLDFFQPVTADFTGKPAVLCHCEERSDAAIFNRTKRRSGMKYGLCFVMILSRIYNFETLCRCIYRPDVNAKQQNSSKFRGLPRYKQRIQQLANRRFMIKGTADPRLIFLHKGLDLVIGLATVVIHKPVFNFFAKHLIGQPIPKCQGTSDLIRTTKALPDMV